MTSGELAEAVQLLQRALTALSGVPVDATSKFTGSLRQSLGALSASATAVIGGGALGSPLAACFDLARNAGATFQGLEAARIVFLTEDPRGIPAQAVNQACIRFALVQQAKVLAATTFTSREDVDVATTLANTAFASSIDFAADFGSGQMYQALVALHAAVIRDLSDRSRPLPRMTTYTFGRSLPALVVANRLYGDATRSDELVLENKASHPLFMAPALKALSA